MLERREVLVRLVDEDAPQRRATASRRRSSISSARRRSGGGAVVRAASSAASATGDRPIGSTSVQRRRRIARRIGRRHVDRLDVDGLGDRRVVARPSRAASSHRSRARAARSARAPAPPVACGARRLGVARTSIGCGGVGRRPRQLDRRRQRDAAPTAAARRRRRAARASTAAMAACSARGSAVTRPVVAQRVDPVAEARLRDPDQREHRARDRPLFLEQPVVDASRLRTRARRARSGRPCGRCP